MFKSHPIFLKKVLKYRNKQIKTTKKRDQWMIEIVGIYLAIQIIFKLSCEHTYA